MGVYLNPGNDAFRMAINDDIYIDKTELIKQTNDRLGKRNRYICVSRPRRFGKSMAAEMHMKVEAVRHMLIATTEKQERYFFSASALAKDRLLFGI